VGFDLLAPGFFWLAGQGGHGIQIAPALAQLAASLIVDSTIPENIEALGFKRDWVCPGRLGDAAQVNSARNPDSLPQRAAAGF
jgi:D-arginine dehydrogenase